jgi:hypothetical protein
MPDPSALFARALPGNARGTEKPLSASNRIEQPVAMLIQFFDYRAKINGLVSEPAVLSDFGLVQNPKSVPLEKFESASAIESNNLGMDLFHSVIPEKSKVGFQKLSTHGDRPDLRQKIDVEMPDCAWCCWHFAPCLGNDPLDEAAGLAIVAPVAMKHSGGLEHVLREAPELVFDRVARTEQVSPYYTVR